MEEEAYPDFTEFSSFATDIDLTQLVGRPCRMIRIVTVGGGGIVLVPVSDASATRTLSGLVANEELRVQATAIKASGTTVSKVRVYY